MRGEKMKVYLDILLFVNIVVDAAILWASAKILHITMKPLRFFSALIISCAYGFIVILPDFGFMANIFMKICMSVLIAAVAFSLRPFKGFMKKYFIFLFISVVYIALILVIQNLFHLQDSVYIRNGAVYFNIPVKYILMGVAVLCIVQIIMSRIMDKKPPSKNLCNCDIDLNGKKVSFKALVDSGNFLKEGLSGLPVILVDSSVLRGIVNMDAEDNFLYDKDDPLYTRFRLVPFRGVGGESGLLKAFKPDKFFVDGKEYKVVVAVSKKRIDNNGIYKGIIPMRIRIALYFPSFP